MTPPKQLNFTLPNFQPATLNLNSTWVVEGFHKDLSMGLPTVSKALQFGAQVS